MWLLLIPPLAAFEMFKMSFRGPLQKNEQRVDAVISCPPRDLHSPDGVSHHWQQQQQQQQHQQYIVEHHRHQHNPQQDRVVQELQHHIQHSMQQQQQHQQPQLLQQQNRYQYQPPYHDHSRLPQFSGPSLPTTLGSVSTGIGRTGVMPPSGYPMATHNHPIMPPTPPMPPQRSAPLTSPRTHIRETTKDIVTAVAHSDINGMSSAVNTVALKDIDIQLTALSGYETYVWMIQMLICLLSSSLSLSRYLYLCLDEEICFSSCYLCLSVSCIERKTSKHQ